MPLGREYYDLEGFQARLDWMIACLAPEGDPLRTMSDLWKAIERTATTRAGTQRMFNMVRSENRAVPDVYIEALIKIFPELSRDLLLEPEFAAFEARAAVIRTATERWKNAANYFAKNRAPLATLGKRYHRGVDETDADFPLIARRLWILEKPMLLEEHAPLPVFTRALRPARITRLDGLACDYTHIKGSLSPAVRQPFNGDAYRLLDASNENGKLAFTLGDASYFDYVNSCEAIGAEIADFALGGDDAARLLDDPAAPFPHALPLRGPPGEVFDLQRRCSVIGVNCLTMVKSYFAGSYSNEQRRLTNKFALHTRDESTLEAQNTTHVVPAGTHQPMSEDFGDQRDASIWRTAVREFCEELFDRKEVTHMCRHGEDLLEHARVKPLVNALFRSGAGKLYLLGFGLDPVTTKPEFLVAIVCDWFHAAIRADLKLEENYEGRVRLYDLSKSALEERVMRPDNDRPLLPAAKACLLQAIRHYDELME